MLDGACYRFDAVGGDISYVGDVRVGGLAVVAFVVVVGEDFPVVAAVHFPAVVEFVVVPVDVVISGEVVDTVEVV